MGNKKIEDKDDVFSIELCGGTHVQRTGDIGLFCIVQESGIAAGIRRIEAVTGRQALARVRAQEQALSTVAATVKASADNLVEKVQQLAASNRSLEKELQQLKARFASARGEELLSSAREIQGIKVLVSEVEGLDSKGLRESADQLRSKLGTSVVVLALRDEDKVSLVVAVSKDLVGRIKAGDLVNRLAVHVGGKGGGRPDMAMAGGTNPAGLARVMASAGEEIGNLLGNGAVQ